MRQLRLFDGSQIGMTVGKTDDHQDSDLRTVKLTPRELELLLHYGYPLPEQEHRLRNSKAVKGVHRVRIGAFWIQLMIADLVRAAEEFSKERCSALFEELEAVCSALEYALADDHSNIRLR